MSVPFTLPEAPATTRDPSWPAPLPERLSPSSIKKFLECSERWRREYLQNERGRVSGALVIGSGDSKAAEVNFLSKQVTGVDLPLDEVQDAARDEVKERVDSEEMEWEDKDGEKDAASALDTTIRVVTFNHAAEYPLVEAPTMVEQQVEFQVEGAPLVRAYLDVATESTVVSRKTAGRAPSGVSRPWMVQSAIESAATGLPTAWHVTTKAAKPRLISPETDGPAYVQFTDPDRTRKYAANLVSTASRSMRALLNEFGPDDTWITAGAGHWGANPDGGLSVCKLCAFRTNGCPAWV